jgi:drug/metabolite transporter (DMT)-like permease
MVAACSAYTIAGPALILLNNHIMNGLSFPYPIALSAFGVTFSAVVCRLLIITGLVPLASPKAARSRRFLVLNTLSLAALAALTLALGNSAYIYLSVATCQILKALTPGMTLFTAYALQIEEPNPIIIGCVIIICLGTAMASSGELDARCGATFLGC